MDRLAVGPIRIIFDRSNGMARNIRVGSTEVLGGLYATVRDHNWDTVLPQIEDLQIDQAREKLAL